MSVNLSPEEIVKNIRLEGRATSRTFIEQICDDFFICAGDRTYGEDEAIIGGIAKIGPHIVTLVATERGQDLKERSSRNFGAPHAEGYRKAIRLYHEAIRFKRPIINLIDTSGASCDQEAEARGIGPVISEAMAVQAQAPVYNLALFIGEGGSGGALALALCNEIWILEDAIFSILSPEGFATILWGDPNRWQEACPLMKFTAPDLKEMGIVDRIIEKNEEDKDFYHLLKKAIIYSIDDWKQKTGEEIIRARYRKFRQY